MHENFIKISLSCFFKKKTSFEYSTKAVGFYLLFNNPLVFWGTWDDSAECFKAQHNNFYFNPPRNPPVLHLGEIFKTLVGV